MTLLAFLLMFALVVTVLVHEWSGWQVKTENPQSEEKTLVSAPRVQPKPKHACKGGPILQECRLLCCSCEGSGQTHVYVSAGSGAVECPLCKGKGLRTVLVEFCACCGKEISSCRC